MDFCFIGVVVYASFCGGPRYELSPKQGHFFCPWSSLKCDLIAWHRQANHKGQYPIMLWGVVRGDMRTFGDMVDDDHEKGHGMVAMVTTTDVLTIFFYIMIGIIVISTMTWNGPCHKSATVLLPGFAIKWQPRLRDLTHIYDSILHRLHVSLIISWRYYCFLFACYHNYSHFYCPACRTSLIATRFRVAVICPIIQVPHCMRVFFYFVWFVFINHIFQLYYELCTYCNILDIYLS